MTDAIVTRFPAPSRLNTTAERILSDSQSADLETVFVIGRKKDGTFFFASSIADGGTVLWEMEIAKAKLIQLELGA